MLNFKLFFLQERIPVVLCRQKSLFNRPKRNPAEQIYFCAGFVICTRTACPSKGLLPNDGAGGFVIDIKITRSIGKHFSSHFNSIPVAGQDRTCEGIRRRAV